MYQWLAMHIREVCKEISHKVTASAVCVTLFKLILTQAKVMVNLVYLADNKFSSLPCLHVAYILGRYKPVLSVHVNPAHVNHGFIWKHCKYCS